MKLNVGFMGFDGTENKRADSVHSAVDKALGIVHGLWPDRPN